MKRILVIAFALGLCACDAVDEAVAAGNHMNHILEKCVQHMKEKQGDTDIPECNGMTEQAEYLKAKTKVKSARRQAAKSADSGEKSAPRADGLDAALVLYQAAQGRIIPPVRIRKAFLTLVELHG